ncbi:unnamed protein product [Rangifer tarandus platyrhynchus]|uniref:Uncharacterized protein n=1 Tax=Rangifer tarandus platyrhynchus TaxID=3082113 RepID=A0ACB1KFX3_RANTA
MRYTDAALPRAVREPSWRDRHVEIAVERSVYAVISYRCDPAPAHTHVLGELTCMSWQREDFPDREMSVRTKTTALSLRPRGNVLSTYICQCFVPRQREFEPTRRKILGVATQLVGMTVRRRDSFRFSSDISMFWNAKQECGAKIYAPLKWRRAGQSDISCLRSPHVPRFDLHVAFRTCRTCNNPTPSVVFCCFKRCGAGTANGR